MSVQSSFHPDINVAEGGKAGCAATVVANMRERLIHLMVAVGERETYIEIAPSKPSFQFKVSADEA